MSREEIPKLGSFLGRRWVDRDSPASLGNTKGLTSCQAPENPHLRWAKWEIRCDFFVCLFSKPVSRCFLPCPAVPLSPSCLGTWGTALALTTSSSPPLCSDTDLGRSPCCCLAPEHTPSRVSCGRQAASAGPDGISSMLQAGHWLLGRVGGAG